ncbi:carcinine hydrolase/isopenicillin-N N-acyltransferase family protein [Rhizobium beringeri]
MPVVLRYVLEFANTTAAAVAMLRDIPVHMSYSIAVIDRQGNHATVYVNPDRPAEVVERRVSTNHQHGVEWACYAEITNSVEREAAVEKLLPASASIKGFLPASIAPRVSGHTTDVTAARSTLPSTGLSTPRWNWFGRGQSGGSPAPISGTRCGPSRFNDGEFAGLAPTFRQGTVSS